MPVLRKDVWEVSELDFPKTAPIETQLGFLLRYAILAPSTKNSQPWAFSVQATESTCSPKSSGVSRSQTPTGASSTSAWAARWRTCWWQPSTSASGTG